jgi:hypothetical protein
MLLPENVSRTGVVVGGLFVWGEFALVSATMIASEWSPNRPSPPFVAALRRHLVLIAIAILILGWIAMLPFAHGIGAELAILVACLAIVLGFRFTRRRSPDPTRPRLRHRALRPERSASEKRAA